MVCVVNFLTCSAKSAMTLSTSVVTVVDVLTPRFCGENEVVTEVEFSGF